MFDQAEDVDKWKVDYEHYLQSYVTGLRVKNETVTNLKNMLALKETQMSFMIINILMQFYNFQIKYKYMNWIPFKFYHSFYKTLIEYTYMFFLKKLSILV